MSVITSGRFAELKQARLSNGSHLTLKTHSHGIGLLPDIQYCSFAQILSNKALAYKNQCRIPTFSKWNDFIASCLSDITFLIQAQCFLKAALHIYGLRYIND